MTTAAGLRIAVDHTALAAFCREHRIRSLRIFGSALRPDFDDESDIDVLVEFDAGYEPGLEFFALGGELSAILKRRADVVTAGFLGTRCRDRIRAEAVPLYDVA